MNQAPADSLESAHITNPLLPLSRRALLGLIFAIVAVLVAWFAGAEYRSLTEPDEGRYAEVAREMVASGDWIVPRTNGFKFYDKPVLHYWVTAVAFEAFGVHNWTARLWTMLAGLISVVSIGYAGMRVFGQREGLIAALVLGSSFLCVIGSHVNSLDMGLTAFLSLLLGAFLIAQHHAADTAICRRWMWLTWLAMALAVMTKGVIAIVLPGAILFFYLLWQRDWGLLRRLHLVSGLIILMVICLPWFIAIGCADSNFYSFFFIHEHLERFLLKTHDRFQPWWFFLPVIVFGAMPWSLFLPAALRRGMDNQSGLFQSSRLLLLWCGTFLLFFSISSSKLALYILPLFPALALLIGIAAARMTSRALMCRLLPITLVATLAFLVLGFFPGLLPLHEPRAANLVFVQIAAIAVALLSLASWLGMWLCRQQKFVTGIAAVAFGGLICTQGLMIGFQQLEPANSADSMAALAAPYLKADTPVYSVKFYFRGLPFYLQRLVTVAYGTPTDLVAGMAWQPELTIAELDGFVAAWRAHPAALAFIRPDIYTELRKENLPMTVIADRQPVVMIVQSPVN